MSTFGRYAAHEVAAWFPLLDGPELADLAESIRREGQIEACVVWGDVLVDGRNRWRACEIAGVEPRIVRREFADETECGRWIIATNVNRRHLTQSQRLLMGERLREREEASAKVRMAATQAKPGEQVRQAKDYSPSPEPAKAVRQARDEAGKAAGVSGRQLDRLREVRRHGSAEVNEAVNAGRLAVSAAAEVAKLPEDKQREIVARVNAAPRNVETPEVRSGLVRQLVKQAVKQDTARRIEAEPAPMPSGPFRVIVADPPWAYEKRAGDASHRVDLPYPSMTTDEIAALDVETLAHPSGCILWLWTTNAFMRDAYRLLDAWGFQEKTILTWVKDRMGMGDWLRGQTEHCILAVRGKPTVLLSNQTTVINGPMREHSRKPDEFYALVDALCPGSKVEMFCRTPRAGWAKWGAETEKFDAAS